MRRLTFDCPVNGANYGPANMQFSRPLSRPLMSKHSLGLFNYTHQHTHTHTHTHTYIYYLRSLKFTLKHCFKPASLIICV